MLVKLYELPEISAGAENDSQRGVTIRRALAPEKHVVARWIREHFSEGWVSEAEVAFARNPISCFIAVRDGTILGFACYDATMKGFFGPTGVDERERGLGVGKKLFLQAMHAMRSEGYGYAIVGGAGPTDFYAKTAGATVIPGSQPGIYEGMLKL